jgi:PAS domain S-box-containing protein
MGGEMHLIVEKKSSNLYEKKYHFLIDNILDVVGELDLNGIFTYVNPYIYDELGYQPDEIIGREIYEFVHPDDAKKITKVLFRRLKSHDFIPEIRLKNDKNQFIWYEIKARMIKDYNNQRKILITLKNISKVKELEERLEKKEENYQKITNSFPEIQFWKVFTPSKYERVIRTTSEMLKVIIENIPQCVFWKDTNFKYLGCNGNYSEFIGIEHPESIVGKTDEDLLSNREKIQQIRESETSVMLSGKSLYHTNESWIIEKGENIWLDVSRVPLIETKGDINGILVTFEEITDRKIAKEKLRNSEKKYKNLSIELETIMDIIPSMIFVKNKSGIYTKVNQVFADYLKLEKEDIIGKSTFDLFPQELATNLKRDDLEVINSGKPKLNIEEKWETVDGLKWVLTTKIPYIDENGEIKGIIGTSVNITEHKIAEQKLIESEAKHRGLLETAVMGLIEIDLLLNNISYVNPKLLEIVGYSREELKDDSIFYKILHPEDLEELLKSHGDRDVEFRIYSKEGKLKWLSGTRKYTISENGELINIRLWLQDITESKEIEEIKSSLLTRFSHEFKTPLISIKGFADFLLTEYKVNLDEKILSFLRRIKEGSNRLEALINSFMEGSQLEEAVIRMNLRQEDVSDLIQEGLHELEGFIGMRKQTISVSLDEKLITTIDKEKIYTVISNILINAIDYTPQGGKISIKSNIDKNFLTISVKDNGIGLTEEEKKCLFKPFGKIERYGKGWDINIGGIGMGLYISKEIIELHGGKIWAESEGRNKGSEFHFSLPIK